MNDSAFKRVLEMIGALVEIFQSLALTLSLGRDEIMMFRALVKRMLQYAAEQLDIRSVKG